MRTPVEFLSAVSRLGLARTGVRLCARPGGTVRFFAVVSPSRRSSGRGSGCARLIENIPLFIFLLLGSCGSPRPDAAAVRPVKVVVAAGAEFLDKNFAGLATPDDAVNLAFKLSGQILDIPVSQGENVKKGALLAELDPRDVRLKVDADKSAYAEAESQLARMKRLLDHEAVSRQEYEAAQTRYAQARSAYENSKDLLADTKLRAPFDAVVEDKYADVYQRVQSGEPILRIVGPTTTTVKFTLPEQGLYLLSLPTTRFAVEFDNYRGVRFDARLKEYAKTSSDASGFPVSLTLEGTSASRYRISPGMSCLVTMRSADPVAGAVSVPVSAIYAPASGGEYVWTVAGDSVVRRAVRLGELFGTDRVVVDSGLVAGERVVSAGVYRLQDGERVRILK